MNSPSAIAVKAQILEMTGEHVDQLHAMWSQLFEVKTCGEFLLRLKDHANSFFTDLLNESREKQQAILNDIAALRAEATDLTRLLHEPLDIGERPESMPLVVWELKLDKSIEHLRDQLARRRAEICELLLQQEQLCEELGELPLPLLADPLPLPEEMDAFRNRLGQLRDQRVLRLKEMDQLRQAIKHDMKLLECLPQTDTEERLLNQVDHCLTPETFELLRNMQKNFADQVKELRSASTICAKRSMCCGTDSRRQTSMPCVACARLRPTLNAPTMSCGRNCSAARPCDARI